MSTPAAVVLAILALGVSALRTAPPPAAPYQVRRHGPERLKMAYGDPLRQVRDHLVARINRDRALHSVRPLRYDPRLSLVGDRFCLDAAMAGSTGHWDVMGRAPYVRWGLAGGVDFHSQNAGSYSNSGGSVEGSPEAIALEIHRQMMAEEPPDDGHRQTILNPLLTHVGIGLAQVGGEFRMTQEFSRVAFEWIEIPDRPVPSGTRVEFAAKPLAGYEVGIVEVAFEPPAKPATPRELSRRGGYGYPKAYRTFRPKLRGGWLYRGGDQGNFDVSESGVFRIRFACDKGPGAYFVLCYVRRKGDRNPEMAPATAAMIAATR